MEDHPVSTCVGHSLVAQEAMEAMTLLMITPQKSLTGEIGQDFILMFSSLFSVFYMITTDKACGILTKNIGI